MYKRLVVKIGSNVLAVPSGLPDEVRMERLVAEISAVKATGCEVVVVSSGAVASGRAVVSTPLPGDEVAARQLLAAVGQVQLIRRYADLFKARGLVCAQVLVTKEDFRDKAHYKNMLRCFDILLAEQVVPVVNENDVISVSELMFTDNDELAGLIASLIRADALVILTNVDGLFTGDPRDPGSVLLEEVPVDQDLAGFIRTGKSDFGRGGMLTKSHIARKVARLGITVHVANGKKDGILTGVLDGSVPHTRFAPLGRTSGQKRYVAHGFAKGVVVVNEGARSALLGARASSLLPVGIVSISGEFNRGDIIRIVDEQERPIGMGMARYNAVTARSLMGLQHQPPLVHYDYLYIQE
jgi:glutamate 5-kinase